MLLNTINSDFIHILKQNTRIHIHTYLKWIFVDTARHMSCIKKVFSNIFNQLKEADEEIKKKLEKKLEYIYTYVYIYLSYYSSN